ncbi:MAG: MBL fold metallo-hydrolase [Mailhella sp.]|nr:MBL fold metallo-hydrolase [Mailhella sp.]
MKIQFLGAAHEVTGSCYVIEAAGHCFAVDCGMHQGGKTSDDRNRQTKLYRAAEVEFILLTHAHIDHSGLIPKFAADGFSGPVYCTAPTKDLAALMLDDSAHIQEMEAEWNTKNKKRHAGSDSAEENSGPLYTAEDAQKAAGLLRAVEFGKPFSPAEGVKVNYRYAGHILGAAFLELEITENGKVSRLVFSGDIGRDGALLVPNPDEPDKPADYVFVESTYGDREHKGENDTQKELAEAIAYSYGHREKVLIPSFAVERTQEILYSLILLTEKGLIPADMPIYVDSPLATKATDVFIKYAKELQTPESPFDLTAITDPRFNIHYTSSAQESQELNTMKGPAIILSSAGMCNAGRIKHHLKHNIWKTGVSVVFVGYQAVGTLGRKIVEGAETIKLFNDELAVKAKVFTIGGFSAHAGQSDLLGWIGAAAKTGSPHIVLVHGEPNALEVLKQKVEERFGLEVSVPEYLEEMTIEPGMVPAVQKNADPTRRSVNWDFVTQELKMRSEQIRSILENADTLSIEEQDELYEALAEINAKMFKLLSRIS